MSDHFQRLNQLLDEALALPTAERKAHVERSCGCDAALRAELERLLAAHEHAGDFLEQSAVPPENDLRIETCGSFIGRYKLLQEIGEGGFGRVFMAEQTEPVHRKVALKIVKAGMDTREVIARFEAERQALALMEHPNIARVLDAGATDTGRPYFVMELVKGIPITDYCDRNHLPMTARLQLFMKVCHAVQHAHQKGIIHRDLKPTNILVTMIDGESVPKIIDFGVAKALGQKLTEKTLFTRFEEFLGTPAYMSPEQAELSGVEVDTRSDIYALGVLLYELLTGVTPFDAETFRKAALDEVRRIIREVEPPKPSTRLRTLGDKLTDVAQHRQVEPATLPRMMHGDLDWIVMKCLEKERGRRYETAGNLAEDIQRHLGHEPVQASPPGTLYRANKFIRRHRVGFTMTTALFASIVLGLIVSLTQYVEARRQRDKALAAEATAEQQRMLAETNQHRAQLEAARSAQVSGFMKDMLKGVGPAVAKGRDTALLTEIVDETAARLSTNLTSQPEVEAELRDILGLVYRDLGQMAQAESMLRKLLPLQKKIFGEENVVVAKSLCDLAYALASQGKRTEAERFYRDALAMQMKLRANPGEPLSGLVSTLKAQDKADEAKAVVEQTVQSCVTLLHQESRLQEVQFMDPVLNALMELKETAAAETLARERLAAQRKAFGNDQWRTGYYLYQLGYASESSMPSEAEGYYREALGIFRKLNVNFTSNAVARYTLMRLARIPGALERSGPEITNLVRELTFFTLGRRGDSLVSFNLRIETPGCYHLFLRCDGHDLGSDSLFAQIKELKDGFGGTNVDFYLIETEGPRDADFATMPWQGEALPETDIPGATVPSEWTIAKPGDYTLEFRNREDGTAVDAFVLQLTNLPPPHAQGPSESESTTNHIFLEREGYVAVEAEHFASRVTGPNNTRWLIVPQETPGDVEHLHYRGTGYIQILPDSTPNRPAPLLLNRAVTRQLEGDIVAAESLIHQVLGLQPNLSADELFSAFVALGDISDRMGDATAARSQFLEALGLLATNGAALYERALLHLAVGDTNGYRGITERIVRQLQSPTPGSDIDLLQWACALAPDAVTNYSPVLEVIRLAVARQTNAAASFSNLQNFGALLYRTHRYPEAVQQLTNAFQASQLVRTNAMRTSPVYGAYFLAMAHAQLGHTNEAAEWFQRASALDPLANTGVINTAPGIVWNRRLTLQLLRREAESVLHPADKAATR